MTSLQESIATYAEILFVEQQPEQEWKARRVSFDSITIHTFPCDIGDNPACHDGCPIRLGDKLLGQSKIDVEEYEEAKKARPKSTGLYLEANERTAL